MLTPVPSIQLAMAHTTFQAEADRCTEFPENQSYYTEKSVLGEKVIDLGGPPTA